MPDRSEVIHLQNDLFRLGYPSVLGKHVLTQGIIQLLAREQTPLREIALLVAKLSKFTEDNNPRGEHDFGMFDFHGERCIWKIDYYDLAYLMGSEDPADLTQALRVLTWNGPTELILQLGYDDLTNWRTGRWQESERSRPN